MGGGDGQSIGTGKVERQGVCVCMCVCVRACVRACVRVCKRYFTDDLVNLNRLCVCLCLSLNRCVFRFYLIFYLRIRNHECYAGYKQHIA